MFKSKNSFNQKNKKSQNSTEFDAPLDQHIKKLQITAEETGVYIPAKKCSSSQALYEVAKQLYESDILLYESFFILMCNNSLIPQSYAKISQGGVTATVVDIKIVAKYCLDSLANSVFLVHNHPSGGLNPSTADDALTKKIKEALALFEIQVLDHIIVTENDYFSYNDNGRIL